MKAVILAAGSARRLSPLTDTKHKCLIEIGQKSILEHQLDALDFYSVKETLIIVGYLKEQIISKYGNQYKGIHLQYIENPLYASTNTVYSLMLAGEYFRRNDFLYFNADVVFHHELLGRLILSDKLTVLGVEVKKCGDEEVKVIVDETRRILRIGKKLSPDECLGEFVGIAKFSAELTEDFITSLKTVVEEGDRMSFFERAVDLILEKHPMFYENISDIPVIEIDFPEDLEKARTIVLPKILAFDKK